MYVPRFLVIAGLFLAFGCSQQDSMQADRSQSLVLLDEPPSVAIAGSFQSTEATNWSYFAKSDTSEIIFTDKVGDGESMLLVPGIGVLGVFRRSVDDTNYLLVSTVGANDVFSLYRYHDSDGDGVPDGGTQSLLLDSGVDPMYVTRLSPGGGPDFYLLDARCQDVLLARDTNADGWPDSLLATRFALADDYPDLKYADDLLEDSAAGVVHAIMGTLTPGGSVHRELRVVLTDGNLDGVAESGVLTDPETAVPYVLGALYDDQTEVFVLGAAGETVEFYRLDQDGDATILLGSRTLTSDKAESVTLSSPLNVGEEIHVRFTAPGAPTVFKKVVDKTPQVIELTPQIWRYDEGATVAVFGQNFTTNMTVKLVTAAGNTYTANYTHIDTNNISVTVPALTLEEDIGSGALFACDPGQTAPGFPGGCALCESATVQGG